MNFSLFIFDSIQRYYSTVYMREEGFLENKLLWRRFHRSYGDGKIFTCLGGVNSVFHEERTILENVRGGRVFVTEKRKKKKMVSLLKRGCK